MHAVARAGPDATITIDANTIGATLIDGAEDAAWTEGAIGRHGETANVARGAGVGNVERFFIRRKGQPVGLSKITDDGSRGAGFGIMAKDEVTRLLLVSFFLGAGFILQAVFGIGKPDNSVRLNNDIVG